MKLLHWIDRKLSAIEYFLLVFLLSSLVGLSFLQVILRNFFNTGIVWLDPLLRNLVLWILFLGAAQAAKIHKHLNIDILTKILKGRSRRLVASVINGFSFFIMIVLIKGALDYVKTQYVNETVYILGVKLWMFQVIIPVGLVLIASSLD